MSISSRDLLCHIRDEAAFIQQATGGLTKDAFVYDEQAKRAVVRSLEIIGEAVKKLPPAFKQQYSHIDWRAMAGMRDKLIHDYFGIDYDIVWDVVQHKIPYTAPL